jgi:hypothetical protein
MNKSRSYAVAAFQIFEPKPLVPHAQARLLRMAEALAGQRDCAHRTDEGLRAWRIVAVWPARQGPQDMQGEEGFRRDGGLQNRGLFSRGGRRDHGA